MKQTPRRTKSRSGSWWPYLVLGILFLTCTFAGTTGATAASSYSLTDLGTPEGVNSYAVAINASGQVVGGAWNASGGPMHAFLTQAAAFQEGDTQGVLKGRNVAGIRFVGSDSIRVVPAR